MDFYIKEGVQEAYLIENFCDSYYQDSDDARKLYHYTNSANYTKDDVVTLFMRKILNGYQYEILPITLADTQLLLRQMSMFRIQKGKKVKIATKEEAKSDTKHLLNFLGKKAVYYTNVIDAKDPYNQPGGVAFNHPLHVSIHSSIALIGVSDENLLFIEQKWNYWSEA